VINVFEFSSKYSPAEVTCAGFGIILSFDRSEGVFSLQENSNKAPKAMKNE
jgi:hypothetical protein